MYPATGAQVADETVLDVGLLELLVLSTAEVEDEELELEVIGRVTDSGDIDC